MGRKGWEMMRNPPLPPLPTPSEPSKPNKPNTTRRVWPEETQVLMNTGAWLLDDDNVPTRVMAARQLHAERYLDAPTMSSPLFRAPITAPISAPIFSSPISGSLRDTPISQGAARTGRRISRNEWTLLIAAVGVVLMLVGTVAVLGFVGLPSSGNNSPSGAGAIAPAATATATATPAPTATATPLPAIAASFLTQDTSTQGNWQGQYGAHGYVIVGDSQQLPSSIQVAPANQQEFDWASSTSDPRALLKGSNPSDRVAACWYATGSFTIDVNITDGQTYQMALYMVDWDQQSRAEIINVLDPSTDTVLDTRSVTGFGSGEWLVWNVRGHIAIQITNAPGSINAVVSGIFFAPASQPGATPTAPTVAPSATDTPGGTPPATPGDATPTDTPTA